jgi:uncharacterized damage-inducible protein DinB
MLRAQSDMAFGEMLQAIDGVAKGQAWAVLPRVGNDHLNTDASIQGIALHVATCKIAYGSIGFKNAEVRWRDLAERLDAFEPDWERAAEFLKEAHHYWMQSWEGLREEDLEAERPHFSGKLWPAWRLITTVIHHDSYHAAQIAMLRYGVGESATPPPSSAEDIRTYCRDLPNW